MSLYSGTDGELRINGTVAARVQNWSFTATQAVLPAQSLGDTDATTIMDVRSYTGSCTLWYYLDTPSSVGDVSTLLRNTIKTGSGSGDVVNTKASELELRLRIKNGTTDGRFINMFVVATSMTMGSSVGEVTSMQMQFQANGAPTGMNF